MFKLTREDTSVALGLFDWRGTNEGARGVANFEYLFNRIWYMLLLKRGCHRHKLQGLSLFLDGLFVLFELLSRRFFLKHSASR